MSRCWPGFAIRRRGPRLEGRHGTEWQGNHQCQDERNQRELERGGKTLIYISRNGIGCRPRIPQVTAQEISHVDEVLFDDRPIESVLGHRFLDRGLIGTIPNDEIDGIPGE